MTLITGIGSLPFRDVDEAIDLIFSVCRNVPFWPQLPQRSFLENMYLQTLYPMPGLVIDEREETLLINTEETSGLEEFYGHVEEGRTDPFALSEEAAPGFYRLLDRLPELGDSVRIIKTQLTGPFTLGLGVRDRSGKPVIYDPAWFDVVKKTLNLRARWMVSAIKKRYPGKEVLLFFDEPYMVSFGSAYVSISKEEVIRLMNEVLEGIDALTAIHCCGNTDWSVLFGVNAHIINYDAFNFLETIFYFREELAAFIYRGGAIAPGIVPSTAEGLSAATPADMEDLEGRFIEICEGSGVDVDHRWLVTPSCGLGSVTVDEARKAFDLLKRLGEG